MCRPLQSRIRPTPGVPPSCPPNCTLHALYCMHSYTTRCMHIAQYICSCTAGTCTVKRAAVLRAQVQCGRRCVTTRQPTNQPTNQLTNLLTNRLTALLVCQRWTYQLTNSLISQPANLLTNQLPGYLPLCPVCVRSGRPARSSSCYCQSCLLLLPAAARSGRPARSSSCWTPCRAGA